MGSKTDYLENKVLDHILGVAAYTQPTIYVALFTSSPTEAGGGTEVTGGSYARQAASFGAASGGAASNSGAITFSSMPACTVVGFALMDAASGGNMLYYADFSSSQGFASGTDAEFAVGDLDITED